VIHSRADCKTPCELCKNPTKDLEINVSEISSIFFVLLLPDNALFSEEKKEKRKD
jgi:hypothetical protein